MAWSNLEQAFSSLRWPSRLSWRAASPGMTFACAVEAADVSTSLSGSRGRAGEPEGEVALLIPAYRPNRALVDLVTALQYGDWAGIVVVDDGSGPECRAIFDELSGLRNVDVVSHAINMGKGAGLKTGINFILCKHPGAIGVVTVDADGQHAPDDVARVCERFRVSPEAMVLGVRTFDRKVPLRSRIGNQITSNVMRLVLGSSLTDTQTGLRAIPRSMLHGLLLVAARGYEFELAALIAAKHGNVTLIEQPIRTIYEPGNPSSHFQPLRDSMRIYFVLLRFTLISISTAALDNLVFFIGLHVTGNVLVSQMAARVASILYAYPLIRRAVFLSEERHQILLPRYVLLVAINATISYAGIESLIRLLPIGVFPAKLLIEALLFIANFLIQRDWIFTRRER
jgi:putative flippase GtrA